MSRAGREDLLDCYRRELAYLRQRGTEFAESHPELGRRLQLQHGDRVDPHVERLLESFAFLTGRIQCNLERLYPEFTTALLDTLYPHYLCPHPSMAIVRFEVDPAQVKLASGFVLPRATPLVTEAPTGKWCRFQTCYPVTLWPFTVIHAAFEARDPAQGFGLPACPAILRLRLRALGGQINDLPLGGLQSLRFHLAGDRTTAQAVAELLLEANSQVSVVRRRPGRKPGPHDEAWTLLPAGSLAAVGFGPDETLLPPQTTALPAFRLLQEYFGFPEKFRFFEVGRLDQGRLSEAVGDVFDLVFFLDRVPSERLLITPSNFLLGCTPAVNLFRKTAEPIRLDHRRTFYPVVPDAHRLHTTEIHSVTGVRGVAREGDQPFVIRPYYSFRHHDDPRARTVFWHVRRELSQRKDLPGTEMEIAFLDRDFAPELPGANTVFADTLCTNRGLAEELPPGTRLHIEEATPVLQITCLGRPTRQLQPPLGGETPWRLVSHLSLGLLSLCCGSEAPTTLRELLGVYDFAESPENRRQILGVADVSGRAVVRRVSGEAWRGFCRGIEVTLTLEESNFASSTPLLFSQVLHQVLTSLATLHSFVELKVKRRHQEGVWKRWPPSTGTRNLR
ncbi:MAG: type VI secretion system baseplate subunit TssF [Verrucomicrobiales bacterium]|nr:type VI secretion system baseplate subunit TssF [Verrucomicrobiales bacterium]